MANAEGVKSDVADYYTKLQATSDLKTSACTACGAPPAFLRAALKNVPPKVSDTFYGCGNPIPEGIESTKHKDGFTVLDLGCGTGRDVFVAAQLIGPAGRVIGVDMTDDQLKIAADAVPDFQKICAEKKVSACQTLDFTKGFIEDLAGAGVAAGSVDLIISNCVVNLSPRKDLVLQSAYDTLKTGGEMYFSDVYCDRRLPSAARQHKVLVGECLGGALYRGDFLSLCKKVGFLDPRVVSEAPIDVHDPELVAVLGPARFYSITYRLFKLDDMDDRCEDYGQVAVYKGTMAGSPFRYALDDGHGFERNRPSLVCGNTAAMLSNTWLGQHFQIIGDKSEHFGAFDCSSGGAPAPAAAAAPAAASDCGGSSCCAPPAAGGGGCGCEGGGCG